MKTITKSIQYFALKIMKRLRPPDDPQVATVTSEHILDKLLPSVMRIFEDEKFRETAGFDKLEQIEHDRIFNELEIAAISLCLFCLEQRQAIIGQEDFHFWKEVHEKIPVQFVKKLSDLGVPAENANLFFDLIRMRHEEYGKIDEGTRDYFYDLEEFKKYGSCAKDMLLRVQSVTVGTTDHIRRGKLKLGDPLMKVMRQWLFPLDMEVEKFIKKL